MERFFIRLLADPLQCRDRDLFKWPGSVCHGPDATVKTKTKPELWQVKIKEVQVRARRLDRAYDQPPELQIQPSP